MHRIDFVPTFPQLEAISKACHQEFLRQNPKPAGFVKNFQFDGGIASIPSDAVGQISATVKGNTRTNLVPTFDSGKWNLHVNVTVDSPTKITLNATADSENSYVEVNAEENKEYTFSFVSNGYFAIQARQSDGTFISTVSPDSSYSNLQEHIFTTPANTGILRIIINNFTDGAGTYIFENIMLEEGTETGNFITGTKSTNSVTVVIQDPEGNETGRWEPDPSLFPLRSLPNGVNDEISTDGTRIQRIGHVDNVASGTVINYADMATGSQFYAWNSLGETQTGVKADTLSINADGLNYQLANSVITEFVPGPTLQAIPGGTIIVEPTIWGILTPKFGQDKYTIAGSERPALSIRKVIRYDISANMVEKVDVTADCTLTDGGTAIQIANIDYNKTYYYDCEAPLESTTYPTVELEYEAYGVAEHDYGAATADWVLSPNEAKANMLVCQNAGGAARIIALEAHGKMFVIKNDSGYTITIKTSTSTGVTVANGMTATVIFYGSDYLKVSEM